MPNENPNQEKPKTKKKKIALIITIELIIVLLLFGFYQLFIHVAHNPEAKEGTDITNQNPDIEDGNDNGSTSNNGTEVGTGSQLEEEKELTSEELEAAKEQERLKKEEQERKDLIVQADQMTLSYDYDGAIELIKSYQGPEGEYQLYPILNQAIERLEEEKSKLVLYGGSYTSVTEFNHIFFHSLIADNSKAFDDDYDSPGYNMYMTTTTEFRNMMQVMYESGYVLVSMSDIVKLVPTEDGSTEYVEAEIYLPEGKKPFVLSVDDVNYYEYMEGDGFASRIVLGKDGKPTCEMVLSDGSTVYGEFDVVPILDAFVEAHPDFSYRGAKGILAITGYEGVLGYRTNNPDSPTYDEDRETAKKVVEVLKEDGWEFASHSWGHKNMGEASFELIKRDTNRWLEEVGTIIGPTDLLIFPYGVDIETTMGLYSSNKYHFLKEKGFNMYIGVYKSPWMQVRKEYIRMTRRPLDGQAMLQFPERLADLFSVEEVIDPDRPPRNW